MKHCSLLVAVLIFVAVTGEADVTACDEAAAHPSDPDKVVAGVSSSKVVTHVAIPACRAAVAAAPDEPRFHYQLGRALVYWAGANNADAAEGTEHVLHAAQMNHEQAQFVLGLLLRETPGKNCEVEQWTRKAADQGLKSARITYVDDSTSGFYSGCKGLADHSQLTNYLQAAKSQVNGYYEKLLWARLSRSLMESHK